MEYKILIIGGKLQGTEALYLAKKAGFFTALADKNPNCIGRNLCDEFLCTNILDKEKEFVELLLWADFILPTIEDEEVLAIIKQLKKELEITVLFDFDAYEVTKSKIKSNELMERCGVLMPKDFKLAKPPFIAKPSVGSGSQGVVLINDQQQFNSFLEETCNGEGWVIQSYLTGRQYSIEVVGYPGNYKAYEVTELFMDMEYDCKRVFAPSGLPENAVKEFENIGINLARGLGLKGIMDVEAIYENGTFYILEIDARMPSQTPAAVYKARGINLLVELVNFFSDKKINQTIKETKLFSCYEHLLVTGEEIKGVGEHYVSISLPLKIQNGLFNSDECISDYSAGDERFVLTLINSGDSKEELCKKREEIREQIQKLKGKRLTYNDASPFEYHEQ